MSETDDRPEHDREDDYEVRLLMRVPGYDAVDARDRFVEHFGKVGAAALVFKVQNLRTGGIEYVMGPDIMTEQELAERVPVDEEIELDDADDDDEPSPGESDGPAGQ